jgi:hypothetical protein
MSTTTVRADIAAFAAAVRSHLDDLPADDVDELVDGLEADLSDQAAEADDAFEIPDAASYAAELRAAAGLGERVAPAPKTRRALVSRWRGARASVVSTLRSYALGAWVLDTLLALRPVWWVLRAAVLYLVLVPFLGISRPLGNDMVDRVIALWSGPAPALLLAALLVVSIQWGRGLWLPTRWMRGLKVGVSIIAVLASPLLLVTVGDARDAVFSARVGYQGPSYTPGLAVDGERVRNVFAYDAAGNALPQVQLFDQSGRPLTTVGRDGQADEWDGYFYGGGGPWPVADRVAGRDPLWNAFPLKELPPEQWRDGIPDPDEAVAPVFPYPSVPPLAAPSNASDAPTVEAQGTTPETGPTP